MFIRAAYSLHNSLYRPMITLSTCISFQKHLHHSLRTLVIQIHIALDNCRC